MTTRAVRLQRTFEVLELSNEAQDYLRDVCNVSNVGRLASIQDDVLDAWAQGTAPLTESDAVEITKFKSWYHTWTKDSEANLADFMADFTEEMWDVYYPTTAVDVHEAEGLHERSEGEGVRNDFKVKADLRQYRRFTGTIDEYVPWKRSTRAVATAQGLGELLDDTYTVPQEEEDEFKVYEQKNALLHSALTMATAEGTAILKVEKFRPMADGRGAWMALRDWYEGQGSNESIAKRAMKLLHTSRFTSTTQNGADGYIQTFEQALQDLEETKHYYDPTMRKIMFLDNIHDESYKIVVEMLKLDDTKTYDDCIMEIRRRSVDVEKEVKIPGKRFFRRANNTGARARPAGRGGRQPQGQGPGAARGDDFVPTHVWNNMSREQQAAVISRRQGPRANQGAGRGPAVLPRQYANANRTGSELNEQGAAIRNAMRTHSSPMGRANINSTHASYHVSKNVSDIYDTSPWSEKKTLFKPIMVIDSATDINILGYGWKVMKNSGVYVDLIGFHAASGALTTAEIVTAIAVAQFSDGNYRWIGVHNGAWAGEEENTSHLSKYHALANGLWVDDTHKAHGGSQCISVWLEDGSYDEISLVPYNRLLTFPLETYSVQNILKGMSEEEVSEFFPDYDQIVWLDRDETVQVMMGDGQEEDQEAHVKGDQDVIARGDYQHPWNPFESSTEEEMDDDSPSEGEMNEEEMVRVLVNHTSTHAVSESSDEEEKDETIESDYGGDIEENDNSSISSESVIGYGRVLASLGGLAGVSFSKATVGATRSRARSLMKKPGVSPASHEREKDLSEGRKATQENPNGLRAQQRATKYEEMRPKLGWMPVDVIEKTFEHTTQLAKRVETREVFRKHLKSRFPELNRRRLRETYATDTFFSSVPALGGATCMQLYVGLTSKFIATYAMKTESEGAETLSDFVRDYGAPYHIRSDNAKMETGHAFTAICRKYNIK